MKYEEDSKPVLSSYGFRSTVCGFSTVLSMYGGDSLRFIQPGLTYNQINSNLLSQAATMNTHGLPNDILSNIDPIAIIIIIPICDLLVSVPQTIYEPYLLRSTSGVSGSTKIRNQLQCAEEDYRWFLHRGVGNDLGSRSVPMLLSYVLLLADEFLFPVLQHFIYKVCPLLGSLLMRKLTPFIDQSLSLFSCDL